MALQYTQKKIEQKIAENLEHGDITKIANITGIGYSYVDQQLNPNDERKSYIVGALELICALDEIDKVRGERLWQQMITIRDSSKKQDSKDNCLKISLQNFHKETNDVISASLKNNDLNKLSIKDLNKLLIESVEAESSAKIYKETIISAINIKKSAFRD